MPTKKKLKQKPASSTRANRHTPDGDGVALQGVSEVRHHAGADEAVDRLDDVEQRLEGGQERERRPVPRVRLRHLQHRRGRRARRSVGGGGRLHLPICPDVDLPCNANRARPGAGRDRAMLLSSACYSSRIDSLGCLSSFFFISKVSLKQSNNDWEFLLLEPAYR
jgi:hypothetical protein